MNKFLNKIICCGALLCSALPAHAQIIVSDAIVEMDNQGALIENIAVGNAHHEHSFTVTPKVYEVQNPGSTQEVSTETNTVFVVPNQFQLSPRSQRSVRIASKVRPEVEKVYKIDFLPQKAETTEPEKSAISVLSSTSVMTIIRPLNPEDNLKWQRSENQITFQNIGNTNIVLRQPKQCTENAECTIPGERLWPNDTWNLQLPDAIAMEDIKLEYRALGNIKEIIIPYE